eukprot:GAHX01001975.1.p1 GENE.GAHX01001975.1~~GAHX01001975.1.p1  ORF type:complete len:266 (-),score=52.45 GAHX01001975.1:24-800(-)
MEEYTYSQKTYSPDGRIYQLEYALELINNSSTIVALKTKDGIILASECKSYSPLQIQTKSNCFFQISENVLCLTTGLFSDCKYIAGELQSFAQSFRFSYNKECGIDGLANRLSKYHLSLNTKDHHKLKKTEGVTLGRPIAASIFLASIEKDNFRLLQIEATGKVSELKVGVSGAGKSTVVKMLKNFNVKDITLKESENLVMRLLNNVMENKINEFNFEIFIVGKTGLVELNEEKKKEMINELFNDEKEKELHENKGVN